MISISTQNTVIIVSTTVTMTEQYISVFLVNITPALPTWN